MSGSNVMSKEGSEIGSNKRAKIDDKGEGFLSGKMMAEKITKSHVIKMIWNKGGREVY